MRCFLGIDQSYTSTGFVVMDESGEVLSLGTYKTSDKNGDIYDRAILLSNELISLSLRYQPVQACIEGLAFGKFGNATRDLAMLQGIIIAKFRTSGGPNFTIVTPNALKKAATGNGKAAKTDMVAALPEKVVELAKDKNLKKSTGLFDVADAYHLANYIRNKWLSEQQTEKVETHVSIP